MSVLLIDNFDSFTYNIYHYLLMCGIDCRLIRNTEPVMEAIEEWKPAGIVFSPGPKRPADHAVMFEVLRRYAYTKPILGICLGHQAIGEFFGATLERAPVPVHGKISLILHNHHIMFKNIPDQLYVARYHSLVISGIDNTQLKMTSATSDGLIMSMAHNSLPVWGIQFHPEAIQTEYGLKMLKNWTSIFS